MQAPSMSHPKDITQDTTDIGLRNVREFEAVCVLCQKQRKINEIHVHMFQDDTIRALTIKIR